MKKDKDEVFDVLLAVIFLAILSVIGTIFLLSGIAFFTKTSLPITFMVVEPIGAWIVTGLGIFFLSAAIYSIAAKGIEISEKTGEQCQNDLGEAIILTGFTILFGLIALWALKTAKDIFTDLFIANFWITARILSSAVILVALTLIVAFCLFLAIALPSIACDACGDEYDE